MLNLIPDPIIQFFLYAETHYKFKGIYSRLFKREPEIIADAPYRVEPGRAIPILLLVKDAHRFPVEIRQVTIEIRQFHRTIAKESMLINLRITNDRYWYRIFYLERPSDLVGPVTIDVQIVAKINGELRSVRNDNYRISSHRPLHVFLSEHGYPKFDHWYFGDFHYHSSYTEDQVEFGAPLEGTVEMARAVGLNFFAVTDHSYDLDDREDSWTQNDHQLGKWHRFLAEVERLNERHADVTILAGEEVSAGNHRNRNVHLLIVNNKHFFPGKGDSAERWFRTRPDLSIQQVLEQLDDENLAIAGHPEMRTPFLQWLLIRRGDWQLPDLQHPRLNGFQIWNGECDRSFYQGSANWVKLLLAGKKLSLIAGNDAHGNFNRFRQIGLPFFTFRESSSQRFGVMRTGVFIEGSATRESILQAVKNHRTLVTNGPVIEMTVDNNAKQRATIGAEISGRELMMNLRAKSSPEFGRLESLKFYRGDLVGQREQIEFQCHNFLDCYFFQWEQRIIESSNNCYFRAELVTRTDAGLEHRCLTSPIWIKN